MSYILTSKSFAKRSECQLQMRMRRMRRHLTAVLMVFKRNQKVLPSSLKNMHVTRKGSCHRFQRSVRELGAIEGNTM